MSDEEDELMQSLQTLENLKKTVPTPRWREVAPYGGRLTENVVSALSRELLVHAMFRPRAVRS